MASPHGVARREVEVARGEPAQVVPVGAEVVVDDVEDHREAARVRRVDEAHQPARAAVDRRGRAQRDAVVAPVPATGKVGDRHQLDRGDPEIDEALEARDQRLEGALLGRGADVDLVEDEVLERDPRGAGVGPREVEIEKL